jgi:hypothetical protein
VFLVANVAGIVLGVAIIRASDKWPRRLLGWALAVVCAVAVGFRLGEGF